MEIKAKTMAIATVAPNGTLGIVIPSAIDKTAPSDAPAETPKVPPSASGFFRSPCIAAPEIAKDPPTNITLKTLGILTFNTIEEFGDDNTFPVIFEIIILKTSPNGIDTLPIDMQIIDEIINMIINIKMCLSLKLSKYFIIH